MPTPLSLTSISTPPLGISSPEMCTGVSLGEKVVAFSMISASRCTTSDTAGPVTEIPGWIFIATLLYCSISDVAARTTSASGTGSLRLRAVSCPASRSRFSEFRRILVTRWSMEKRLTATGGISLVLLKGVDHARQPLDQRLAAPGQVDEHRVEAAAQHRLVAGQPYRFGVYLVERAGDLADLIGGHHVDRRHVQARGRSVSSPSRRTRSGSCTVAMSSAPSRSRRSGRTRDLATASVAISTRSRMTVVTMALNSADCSASRRAAPGCARRCSWPPRARRPASCRSCRTSPSTSAQVRCPG